MKVIADQDMYISTTWGASIRLYAGEAKELGDDIGLLALQEGAKRVDEPILNNPSLIAEQQEVEEAITVIVEGEREEKLVEAMKQILENGSPEDFTSDGLPKQSAIKAIFGEQVGADEREETWAEIIVNKEEE
jgi:phosphotransferase system HPr-like phosphotransfer protein